MNDERLLISKTETIGVKEIRTLMELSQTVGKMITHDEYAAIASVYNKAINRLLRENGEEE